MREPGRSLPPRLLCLALLLAAASGCAYHRENRKEMALAHYRMAEAYLQKGRGLGDEVNRRQAYPELIQAIEKDPANPDFHIQMGNIYLYDRKYDAAAAQYREALRLAPPDSAQGANAHQNLGQAYLATAKYEDAIKEFDQALANYSYQTPTFAHFNKGRAYFELGDCKSALVPLRAALDIAPDFEAAWHLMGKCLEKENRLTDAERAFRRAVELLPSSAPNHYYLGLVLSRQKRKTEAGDEFRKVIELDPDGDLGKNASKYLSILP